MKRLAIEDLASRIDVLVATMPKEKLLLTLRGEPFALVSDATMYDWEDIGYMTDPGFWKMIDERRQEKGGITLEEVEARIAERERAEGKTNPRKNKNGKRKKAG